jgi:HxlR-like helix-turn-helix
MPQQSAPLPRHEAGTCNEVVLDWGHGRRCFPSRDLIRLGAPRPRTRVRAPTTSTCERSRVHVFPCGRKAGLVLRRLPAQRPFWVKRRLSSQHHFTSACSQKRTSQRLGYPWLRHGGPHAGVIGTRLYESHPPRYEYFLTDKGMALGPVLKALYSWGGRHG